MNLDRKIEKLFEVVFEKWATVIVNHTGKVLTITMIVIFAIIAGIRF